MSIKKNKNFFFFFLDLKKKYSTILKTSPCVFCLGSLYDGGYLHDLHEKIPFIKKQSEEYGDDVSMRIGMRSRITVHKKCYDDYMDRSKHKDIILKNSNSEDFSNCSVKTVISEDEIIQEPPKIKPFFCLKKFKPPQLDPGKFLNDLFIFFLTLFTFYLKRKKIDNRK